MTSMIFYNNHFHAWTTAICLLLPLSESFAGPTGEPGALLRNGSCHPESYALGQDARRLGLPCRISRWRSRPGRVETYYRRGPRGSEIHGTGYRFYGRRCPAYFYPHTIVLRNS